MASLCSMSPLRRLPGQRLTLRGGSRYLLPVQTRRRTSCRCRLPHRTEDKSIYGTCWHVDDVCRVSTAWSLVAAFAVTHAALPAIGSTTASRPFIRMSWIRRPCTACPTFFLISSLQRDVVAADIIWRNTNRLCQRVGEFHANNHAYLSDVVKRRARSEA